MLSNVVTRPMTPADIPLVTALHDRVFGPGRFARTAYRVREAMPDATVTPYCRLTVSNDQLIAALRMSEIKIGEREGAVLLGPLVVAPEYENQGFGRALVREAVEAARSAGRKLVVLIGDEPYYGRLGFQHVPPGSITFPGPINSRRILVIELADGALAHYSGAISAR